jgi:PDZ domain
MNRNGWRPLAVSLSVLAASAFLGSDAVRAEDKPKESHSADNEVKGVRVPDVLIAEPSLLHGETVANANHYWIGVMCQPAGEPLHAQLPDLPRDQGLLVQQVIPDSPAAKAGIQPNDILFSAGDNGLREVADLSRAVEVTKETELPIKLLRGGKTITIGVKPAERKPEALNIAASPAGNDVEKIQKWMQQLVPENGAARPFDVRGYLAGPGVVLQPGMGLKHELPDDLSIDIRREGKKPAKITVKKGDQKWEVTEGDLAKLPEDVRREVEPFVAGGPVQIRLGQDNGEPIRIGSLQLGDALTHSPAEIEGRIEKRLDEMSQRLDEVRATLKDLREQRQHHNGADGEKPR